jgi:hypothetical protein
VKVERSSICSESSCTEVKGSGDDHEAKGSVADGH